MKLKKTVSVLCVVFCLIFALTCRFEMSARAQSVSVTVNPSESIQAAIDNATAGETIFVTSGTYDINGSLEVNQTGVSLIGDGSGTTFINGNSTQSIINIAANDVTIEGFTIECTSNVNPISGVALSLFGRATISDNVIEDSQQGINMESSQYNIISDNIITNNTSAYEGAVSLIVSSYNTFSGNIVSNNYGGIYMSTSNFNVFSDNTFASNYPLEETMDSCGGNTFYDNNFIDELQVRGTLKNAFDYGGQGNYWTNYVGQDAGDGTGVTSYVLAQNNRDNHPLLGEFSTFTATYAGEPYQVSVISNSTISAFGFEVGTETGNEIVKVDVTGLEGTTGFSRIAIPTALIPTALINTSLVLVGDKETNALFFLSTPNPGVNTLYMTYPSGNESILIISSELLTDYLLLSANYSALYENYTTQFGLLSNETLRFNILNSLTAQLNDSYANLLGNYSQLLQAYESLYSSYQQHLIDENQNVQNVHSLMYIFATATAVLIVATVYFSKRLFLQPKEHSERREPILGQGSGS